MQNNETTQLKYNVVIVEKTTTPEGMPGDNWHHYVIGHGSSQIEGLKPGTLKAVTQHAQAVADDLNERAGKSGSTYAPRQRQNKK